MKKLVVISASVLLAFGCASSKAPTAMATLQPSSGQTAKGTVHYSDAGEGNVDVQVDLTGVPPGTHGFHIHEKGDCGNNGANAGGHFNPTGMVHGAPDAVSHHSGDFGNVTAEANGEVHTRLTTHSISLKSGEATNPVGKAVVLHEKADDLVSQPSGNAGARIACGIIETMTAGMHP
ncbi:MAG TPA: superoxide dismutase family protein [Thermoanaerobaculia bacterium]|nr:superoxide dismutase family protein [Thermoanaerobaculia bacterium]